MHLQLWVSELGLHRKSLSVIGFTLASFSLLWTTIYGVCFQFWKLATGGPFRMLAFYVISLDPYAFWFLKNNI